MNKIFITSVIAGLMAVGLFAHVAFAQVPAEQSTGETYMALALSIVSIAGNVFNAYLAQKARLTGQAPNSTDIRIAEQLSNLAERLKNSEAKGAQLIDFLYNNAVPQQAKTIVEGSLPLIKVQKVTADVRDAERKFLEAKSLLESVQIGVAETKPIEKL